MFIIRELIRNHAVFGRQILPGYGWVDWGKRGETILELPDDVGRQLIRDTRSRIYREVKLPEAATSVPVVEPIKARKPRSRKKVK